MRRHVIGLGLVSLALTAAGLDRMAVGAEAAATLENQVAAVTAALSCATVNASFGPGHSVRLTGQVGSEQDIARLEQALRAIPGLGRVETDLEIDPWPMCELLEVLAPYRDASPSAEPGLEIATASRKTRLRAGDDLTLDVFLPRSARYLYLGYVQHDGRVGYITTMPVRQWAEGTGAIRVATGYEIAEPFGREMIVAVTSPHPLFDRPRPGYEPAKEYIAALRQRLEALQASEPARSVAVGHLFITTEPAPSL